MRHTFKGMFDSSKYMIIDHNNEYVHSEHGERGGRSLQSVERPDFEQQCWRSVQIQVSGNTVK